MGRISRTGRDENNEGVLISGYRLLVSTLLFFKIGDVFDKGVTFEVCFYSMMEENSIG